MDIQYALKKNRRIGRAIFVLALVWVIVFLPYQVHAQGTPFFDQARLADPLQGAVCNDGKTTPLNFTNIPTPVGAGCACDYEYADATPLTGGKVYTIRCDEKFNLVCSRNNSSPRVEVMVSQDTGSGAPVRKVRNFCLRRVNTQCNGLLECEEGTVCEEGVCKKDLGEASVGGLFGDEASDIRDTIRLFINLALGFLGIITVVMMVYGGILWLTAAGSDDKVAKGKHTLIWAATGALIISIAWTISSYMLQIGQEV